MGKICNVEVHDSFVFNDTAITEHKKPNSPLVRRETRTGSNDLNVLYRPLKTSEMLGHETNRKIVEKWLAEGTTPHTLLFTGDPG